VRGILEAQDAGGDARGLFGNIDREDAVARIISDRAAWRADRGSIALIDFRPFAAGDAGFGDRQRLKRAYRREAGLGGDVEELRGGRGRGRSRGAAPPPPMPPPVPPVPPPVLAPPPDGGAMLPAVSGPDAPPQAASARSGRAAIKLRIIGHSPIRSRGT